MRLSQSQIDKLKVLLKDNCGLLCNDEEAQKAGLTILRFVISKELRAKTVEKSARQVPNGV